MNHADPPGNPQEDERLRALALRAILREGLAQLDSMGADLAAAHLSACLDALKLHFDLD